MCNQALPNQPFLKPSSLADFTLPYLDTRGSDNNNHRFHSPWQTISLLHTYKIQLVLYTASLCREHRFCGSHQSREWPSTQLCAGVYVQCARVVTTGCGVKKRRDGGQCAGRAQAAVRGQRGGLHSHSLDGLWYWRCLLSGAEGTIVHSRAHGVPRAERGSNYN